MMRWISVKDRLPEDYGRCIVLDGKEVEPANFIKEDSEEKKVFLTPDTWDIDYIKGVTHWMPLPEPPKDAQNMED